MTTSKRNSEETKKRILKTALKIFAKKGYDATTTREICEGANININLIYYYFGGKKELYNALINNVFEKQTEFMSSRFDLSKDFINLTQPQKIEMLHRFANAMVDFFYEGISKEQVSFFLQVQQNNEGLASSPPAYKYLIRLFSSIFENKSKREIIYEILFFVSQITFPKIVPIFSLKALKQKDFNALDVELIRNHVKNYINTMIYETVG